MGNEQIGAGDGAGKALVAVRGLTPSQVDAWVEEAQPGARLCYYHGRSFALEGSEALGDHLRLQEERGLLFLYQGRRDDYGDRDYIAERSSRPAVTDVATRKRPLTLHELARQFAERSGR